MPNRKIALNLSGVFWVAEKAAIGPANAIPVRTAAGMARTISGDWAAPNATMTSVKTARDQRQPGRDPGRLPSAMSRGEIGVAYIAWKTLLQISPPMIGNVASNEARLHRRRGQQARREEDEVRHAAEWPSCSTTYAPSPMPIAVRNRTGDRNDEKIDARNVRR